MAKQKFRHWMPRQGGVAMCAMVKRTTAQGQLIFTGRNGHTVWFLTPITNSDPGGAGFMLIAAESEGPPEAFEAGDAA
jgi:hypothetical protein